MSNSIPEVSSMTLTNIHHLAHDPGRRVITESEAAALCCFSVVHFRRLRKAGTGPRYVQLGMRRLGYRLRDVETWIDARLSGGGGSEGPDKATPKAA